MFGIIDLLQHPVMWLSGDPRRYPSPPLSLPSFALHYLVLKQTICMIPSRLTLITLLLSFKVASHFIQISSCHGDQVAFCFFSA